MDFCSFSFSLCVTASICLSLCLSCTSVYCRSLSFIEDFLRKNVMPYYANTHTTTGITSRQSTYYLQEARCVDVGVGMGMGVGMGVGVCVHSYACMC